MKTKIFKTLTMALCAMVFSLTVNAQLPNFIKVDTGAVTQLWGGHVSSTCFDMDNDEDLDLFVSNSAVGITRIFSIFKNEGNGYYVEMPEFITDLEFATVSSYGDIDNDGDADLFAGLPYNTLRVYPNDGYGNFESYTTVSSPDIQYYPVLLDLNNDGFLDLVAIDRWGSVCYNDENGGFLPSQNLGLFQQQENVTLHSVSWGDVDNDGDMDFYGGYSPTNENGIPKNTCWLNSGDGSFVQFDLTSIIVQGNCYTTSVNWVDYDNDGDMDLYVNNFFCDDSPSALYENMGDMQFTKHVIEDELYRYSHTVSTVWGDLDNDADLDLFITVENNVNPITGTTSATPFNILYLNDGNGQFTEFLDEQHPLVNEDTHTALLFDHDNDGDLDVLMTRYSWSNNGYDNIFENQGNNNSWVVLTCEGTASNRSAIGTRVQAKCFVNGKHITQTREITPINGHLSYANLRVHFGMGDTDVIDTLIIRWPSGIVDEYFDVPANKFYHAIEDEGIGLECMPEGIMFTSQAQIDDFQTNYPNCIEINGNVEISGSNITNLNGLSNIQVIDGKLKIHDNDALDHLSGLENLESLNGDFEVYSNNILEDYSGLENLTSINGDIKIYDNGSLSSLTGLENIDPESIIDLTIAVNSNLSYCAIMNICEYLVEPGGKVTIQNNAQGCDSEEELYEICWNNVNEFNFNSDISILPNPFSASTIFEYELIQPTKIQITIYNHLGKQVEVIEQHQSQGKQQIVWNAEGLPAGVYFCVVKTERTQQTIKLVKLE